MILQYIIPFDDPSIPNQTFIEMIPLNNKVSINILLVSLFSLVYYINFDAVVVVVVMNINYFNSINQSIKKRPEPPYLTPMLCIYWIIPCKQGWRYGRDRGDSPLIETC